MRPRWTNRTTGHSGPTTTVCVRLAPEDVKFIDSRLGRPDLRTRTDALQDAVKLWIVLEGRDES